MLWKPFRVVGALFPCVAWVVAACGPCGAEPASPPVEGASGAEQAPSAEGPTAAQASRAGERPAARPTGAGAVAAGGATPESLAAGPTPAAVEGDAAPPLEVRPPTLYAPLSPEVVEHMRSLASAGGVLYEDRVSKLGGSSVQSRAFMHCLDSPDEVTLAEHEGLAETVAFFARSPARPRSFSRQSLATKVGWSIRHGMGGRPPHVLRELAAHRPRWALAFFGGNDVQGRDARRYAERLDHLVTTLERRGVVPVLASIPPRPRDRSMNEQVLRYNRVTRALAEVRRVPFVDIYPVLDALPGKGLARDGVHPNVYTEGRRTRPCDFSTEGQQYGQNVRNLMTLEVLDRARRAYDGEPAHVAPSATPLAGEGTSTVPYGVEEAPFAHRVALEGERASGIDRYAGCGEHEAPGPELLYRVRVDAPTRLWVTALAMGDVAARIFVLPEEPLPDACLIDAGDDRVLDLEPGVYHLAVELTPRRRADTSEEARLLMMATVVGETTTSAR